MLPSQHQLVDCLSFNASSATLVFLQQVGSSCTLILSFNFLSVYLSVNCTYNQNNKLSKFLHAFVRHVTEHDQKCIYVKTSLCQQYLSPHFTNLPQRRKIMRSCSCFLGFFFLINAYWHISFVCWFASFIQMECWDILNIFKLFSHSILQD